MRPPHPSVYIQDELTARHWTRDQLATAMTDPGDRDGWQVNRCAIDLYLEVGPDDPHLRMGHEGSALYARAFGTSAQLWMNLEATWLSGDPPIPGGEP